jgi:Putative Ig domain
MFKFAAASVRVLAVSVGLWMIAGCESNQITAPNETVLPSITTASLPSGTIGLAYRATIAGVNGSEPYNFSISAGTVPNGLALSETGVLAGTPDVGGNFTFTATLTDAGLKTASAVYNLAIGQPVAQLQVGPTTLPVAITNSSYSVPLQITGGTAPFTLSMIGGTLPAGLSLSTAGVLSGTATVDGNYSFTVQVLDRGAPQQKATATITLQVVDATVAIDTTKPLVTVPQGFFGMHTSVYDSSLNDVARLPALLQGTGIQTLRYPGGSYSDRYHWAQHSLTPLYASAAPACYLSQTGPVFEGALAAGADFGSFVRTLQAAGAQALITVNYGTSVADANGSVTAGTGGLPNLCSEPNMAGQPQEAAAWVAYANGSASNTQVIGVDAVGFDWKTVGFWAGLRAVIPLAVDDGYNFLRLGLTAPIGIKNWEVGNEMYYNGWAGNRNFEADLHAPYTYPGGYLSGQDFDSRDSLPALSPTAYGANAMPWVTAMKAVDPTISVGIDFASPGATDPIPLNWNPDLAASACANGAFDIAIIHYYPGTWMAVEPGELLSLPESDLPRQVAGIKANLTASCANASAIKFVLSETSPNGPLEPGFPQPVIGLFALNEYLVALQTGIQNIDWLELHNSTYLDPNENPEPVYWGLEMGHLLASPGDKLVSAIETGNSVLGWATLKANGQKGVLLINASASTQAVVQVQVTGSTLGSAATEYIYGVNWGTPSGPAITGMPYTLNGSTFNVSVPAYTAVEMTIP